MFFKKEKQELDSLIQLLKESTYDLKREVINLREMRRFILNRTDQIMTKLTLKIENNTGVDDLKYLVEAVQDSKLSIRRADELMKKYNFNQYGEQNDNRN